MRTVKEVINLLSELNQDDEIWATWVGKSDLIDIIVETDYTDNLGNSIELDENLITNSFLHDVMASVDNAEYVWDKFHEELTDSTRDKYEGLIHNKMEAVEDTELWDTE